MDSLALVKTWAPDASPWSPWVKPVPFAFWPRALKSSPVSLRPEIIPALFPPSAENRALLIDLPGGESVRCGLLLASLGYRPVPVFSSCPLPAGQQGLYPCTVDADEIITALAECAPALAGLPLPPAAPPAFLIDALRLSPAVITHHDHFDNRSAIFGSDFPSAQTMRQAGINRVLIVRDANIPPSPDLGHALNSWRRQGLDIEAINTMGRHEEMSWPSYGFFGKLFHIMRTVLNLHPGEAGGYGRFIAESSGG